MLFNSTVFLQFFAAFLLLYYAVRNHLGARNLLIVVASYIFYGWWDWRFLGLLAFSSVFDFYVGLMLGQTNDQARRKLILSASVIVNLTILGFFKYFNFFTASMVDLLHVFGIPLQTSTLGVLLPVGISFYTFQSMSYALDVYRGQLKPTRNLIQFLAYVSFFPQLVAGPIERATHLLPQFARTLEITLPMIREGIWLGIWGMFKKVVIADNFAPLAEMAYGHSAPGAAVVVLGTIAFGLQIYCDFSGYSDIARGLAKILGFELMVNFNLPYTASSVREFWQRWHISLSTWLRDYLYVPLGGNRLGAARTYVNLFLTMLIGGFWHGAKWTFVFWGAWHGIALIAHRATSKESRPKWSFAGWLTTMLVVFFGWLLFRAESLNHAISLLQELGRFEPPQWIANYTLSMVIFAIPLVISEIWQRKGKRWPLPFVQAFCLIAIILYWERSQTPFIYFQF